jgi:hypothetical protein
MEDSYERLLRAAKELGKADTPAEVARLLGISDQTIQNWKSRGVPNSELVKIEEKVGALARWIATGRGMMSIPLTNSSLTAEQKRILATMESIQADARNALLQALSLLAKSNQSSVNDLWPKPQLDHGVKEESASVESQSAKTWPEVDRRKVDVEHMPDRRRPHQGVPSPITRLPKKTDKTPKRKENG